MKIGVFGGTFDPPHIAHQILASEALTQIKLDLILWVLTPVPPHKIQLKITPVEARTKLVECAVDDNQKFCLSRVDIDRDSPHYAVDTVTILKDKSPQDEFYYLMGMDSLIDLPKWHQPTDFVKICDWIVVMKREGEKINIAKTQEMFPGIGRKLLLLNSPSIDISSSDIRRRIKTGIEYRYFIPEKVYRYIKENRLYLD